MSFHLNADPKDQPPPLASPEFHEQIREAAIIPVLTSESVPTALATAKALRSGGLSVIEVTLRTAASLAAIHEIAKDSALIVGAGTVITAVDVNMAVAAGARFVISPGLDEQAVDAARAAGVPIIPGVATPTEIQSALRLGLSVMKLFPAQLLGGTDYIRALAGPFPGLRLIPTGGITAENMQDYLRSGSVLAVAGSWIATQQLQQDGELNTITRLAADARHRALAVRA